MARILTVILVLFAMLLAACGDSSSGTTSGGAAPVAIEAKAVEFDITPDTWTVPVGVDVTITFDNAGTIEHEWVVLSEPIVDEASFDESMVLFEIEAVPPGGSETETFVMAQPGTYRVGCLIEGHFNAGMQADLIVTG